MGEIEEILSRFETELKDEVNVLIVGDNKVVKFQSLSLIKEGEGITDIDATERKKKERVVGLR